MDTGFPHLKFHGPACRFDGVCQDVLQHSTQLARVFTVPENHLPVYRIIVILAINHRKTWLYLRRKAELTAILLNTTVNEIYALLTLSAAEIREILHPQRLVRHHLPCNRDIFVYIIRFSGNFR